jgi:hypothetical protein
MHKKSDCHAAKEKLIVRIEIQKDEKYDSTPPNIGHNAQYRVIVS